MCVLDKNLNILQVNPSFENFFKLSLGELINTSVLKIFHPLDLDEFISKIDNLVQTDGNQGLIVVSNFTTKERASATLEWKLDYNPEKKLFYCLGKDITELLYNKKEVETNSFILQQIIDLVPHPIFLKDKYGKYTLVNQAQADLFYSSKDKMLGKLDSEFLTDQEEVEVILKSDKMVLDNSQTITLPEQKITYLDSKKILYTTKLPFVDVAGDTGLLGVSIDMTDIRNTEIELKRTNFELDSFVYRSSHDMRAPLRSILGLLNLIKEESNEHLRNQCLKLAEESVIKLDSFLVDLTNFSRNGRLDLDLKSVDFNEIINSSCIDLGYMDGFENLKITSQFELNEVFISDPTRIKIIFQNLISNSIKYRQTGKDSFLNISIKTTKGACLITFVDNGIGIKQEYKSKVFDMFYRASELSFGSGLGLYIVKQIVEKLQGNITIFTEENIGTKFEIILPNFNS